MDSACQRRLFLVCTAAQEAGAKFMANGGNVKKKMLFDCFFSCVPSGAGGQRPLPCGGPSEEQRRPAPPLLFWGPEQGNGTESDQKFFFVFSEPTCPPSANVVKPTVVEPI